jgi:hypothetical protein
MDPTSGAGWMDYAATPLDTNGPFPSNRRWWSEPLAKRSTADGTCSG